MNISEEGIPNTVSIDEVTMTPETGIAAGKKEHRRINTKRAQLVAMPGTPRQRKWSQKRMNIARTLGEAPNKNNMLSEISSGTPI